MSNPISCSAPRAVSEIEDITRALFEEAIPGALKRCEAGERLIIVVRAPNAWLSSIDQMFVSRFPEMPRLWLREGGGTTAFRACLDDIARDERAVVLLSHRLGIPPLWRAVTHLLADIEELSPQALRRVIRRRTGSDPGPLRHGLSCAADPEAVAECFASGRPPREMATCVAALGRFDPRRAGPS